MDNWHPVYDFQVKFHSFFRQNAWFLDPVYKKSLKIFELACDANELNPWINPSANQCTKASSESCCVDRLYVIKSDLFNCPFIFTLPAIGRRILEFSQSRGVLEWKKNWTNQIWLQITNPRSRIQKKLLCADSQTDLTRVSTNLTGCKQATLSLRQSKNHTMKDATSPCSLWMGVPPSPQIVSIKKNYWNLT